MSEYKLPDPIDKLQQQGANCWKDDGAYGIVAIYRQEEKLVAGKTVKGDDSRLDLIRREISLLHSFAVESQNYIIHFYGYSVCPTDNSYCIYTELCLCSLDHILSQTKYKMLQVAPRNANGIERTTLVQALTLGTWQNAVDCFGQIVSCVHYLHTLPTPIAHRDIKPHNILRAQGSELIFKLCDFGFAKHLVGGKNTTDVGTGWYAAPETSLHPAVYGLPADVYSLGATLLDILCKYHSNWELKRSYQDWKNQRRTLQIDQVDWEHFKTTRVADSEIHAYVDLACMMMARSPDRRPTIQTVLNALKSQDLLQSLNDLNLQASQAVSSDDEQTRYLPILAWLRDGYVSLEGNITAKVVSPPSQYDNNHIMFETNVPNVWAVMRVNLEGVQH